ncbi:ATP-binding protein [Elusimicrobiota bacterium]
MLKQLQVLLIEDNHGDARLIEEMFNEAGTDKYSFIWKKSLHEGFECINNSDISIVLLDLSLPDSSGLDTFRKTYKKIPAVPIIVLSGLSDETVAVDAVKAGAQDYLVKGNLNSSWLIRAIQYGIERKQLMEVLKVKENAVESSITGIAMANLEGKLTYVNNSFLKMWGYNDTDEVIGISVLEFWHKKDEILKMLEFLNKKGKWSGELIARKKNGLLFNIQLSANVVMNEAGNIICMMGSFMDITERKKIEKDLADALKIKSQFTAMVSHELRTPLTAIKEGIGIVLDGSTGELNSIQIDFLDTAKRNVDRLHRLINDVLDFTKLQAGKADFNMEKHNINNSIIEAVKTYNTVAIEKGIYINTVLSPDLPSAIFDFDKIMQVLNNLVSNAIKFTKNGGISLSSRINDETNEVEITIEDTGPGISNEDLPKLFVEFHQINHEKYRKPGGSGLGLSICKDIIEAHKGRIWAESIENEGTKFIFTLPLKTAGIKQLEVTNV